MLKKHSIPFLKTYEYITDFKYRDKMNLIIITIALLSTKNQ